VAHDRDVPAGAALQAVAAGLPAGVDRTAGAPAWQERFQAGQIAAAAYARAVTAADAVHPASRASSDAVARTRQRAVVALRRPIVAAPVSAPFPLRVPPPWLFLQAVAGLAVVRCAAA
jgi:hypothetical protein